MPPTTAASSRASRSPAPRSISSAPRDFTAPDAFDAKTADQHATAELSLPDRVAAGARWKHGRVAVLADLIVNWWKVNDELAIDFENEATPDPVQKNNWQSTLALRAAAGL